tara:strand:+ start:384 stop:1109 length:726 start_codon:yes stop_codon:yes gene_type:complete
MISKELLLKQHYMLSIIMLVVCIIVPYFGYKLKNNNYKFFFSIFLIVVAILQEILDYTNRIVIDELYTLSLDKDLPFHLCHFGFYFSLLAIYFKCSKNKISEKKVQFLFDIAFAIGFSGALQGILTVDLTDINNTIGVITGHLQHSLIILNSIWLIFVYKMRFSIKGILNFFIFLNVLVIPLGLINYFLGSNYLFLCTAPAVENPLLFTSEWPYYILIIDVFSIVYMYVLYLPFMIYDKLK